MISLLDMSKANYPTVALPETISEPPSDGHAAAYRPAPQLDGTLLVDPDIHLPSPGIDVHIAYYYNSNSSYNGPFGYGRTINTNLTAQATEAVVTLTRGNGAVVSYRKSSYTYWPQTPGLMNALVQNTTASYWEETTPDGLKTAYPLNTSNMVTSIAYAEDAVGNRHTFNYSEGLLESLQDTTGRRVTFSYTQDPVLMLILDWAGRRTTFSYDYGVSGKPLLKQVTGPSGCQTLYSYSYGATPRLIGITDPNGYLTTYSYDLRRESRMKDCRTLLIRSDSTCRPIGSTLRGRAARQRAV